MTAAARKLELADELDEDGRHERDDLLTAFCVENYPGCDAWAQACRFKEAVAPFLRSWHERDSLKWTCPYPSGSADAAIWLILRSH